MTTKLFKIPSESIFYSFIEKHRTSIKTTHTTNGPEYYIDSQLVGKVTHDLDKSEYLASKDIISDVRIDKEEALSDVEISFINDALSGNLVYAVNIMTMTGTPTKSIYEQAKTNGLSSIGKNDFFVKRSQVIPKEDFLNAT